MAEDAALWDLVWGKPQVDPQALAEAVAREAGRPGLDFRTRLLIRDAADALEGRWGRERWQAWLARCGAGERVEAIRREELGEPGFPFLREALMEPTTPD